MTGALRLREYGGRVNSASKRASRTQDACKATLS